VFDLGGTVFKTVPVKLERKKLYGYTDVVATDAAGEVCQAARLDPDGSLVVPPKGVKQAQGPAEARHPRLLFEGPAPRPDGGRHRRERQEGLGRGIAWRGTLGQSGYLAL
jgi:hypothetical protein